MILFVLRPTASYGAGVRRLLSAVCAIIQKQITAYSLRGNHSTAIHFTPK